MKKALEGLPGVSEVAFSERVDTFVIEGNALELGEAVEHTVLGQVMFPGLRRFLGNLTSRELPRNRAGKSRLGRGIWAVKPT